MPAPNDLNAAATALPYGSLLVEGCATAGQPSEGAWAAIAAAGYRTVIDLRESYEPRGYDEPTAVQKAGLSYVHIPVTPATLSDKQFDTFRSIVNDPARRPVLVHCATANRVGGLMLPYLVLDEHRPPAEAMRTAQQIGLRGADYANAALEYIKKHEKQE